MSLTNPTVHIPVEGSLGSWLRRHLAWMLIGLAVVAAAVLVTVLVFDGESTVDPAPAAQTNSLVERGSISAIDHRDSLRAGAPGALDRSITAIDHNTAGGGGAP